MLENQILMRLWEINKRKERTIDKKLHYSIFSLPDCSIGKQRMQTAVDATGD